MEILSTDSMEGKLNGVPGLAAAPAYALSLSLKAS